MFITKSSLLLFFLALCNLVVAMPPACLLSAMGNQQAPGDLKTICGKDVDKVESQISQACGDQEQAAMKYFASKCASAGFKVAIPTATASGSSSTGTGTSGTSPSGFVTTTAAAGSSSNGAGASSTSSSPSATSTNGSPSDRHVSAAAFAAVVFVAFAATL